ncbi:MAG TPA: hypothetical protein PLC65_04245 [Bacteroidia bacterium]|nr:hypothetical protein [Bacteroidia bacterium]
MRFIVYIFIAFLFYSCKKYPENTLWFKNPAKAFKGGHITSILVNGVDSLSYMSNLCGFDISEQSFTYFCDWHGLTADKIKGSLRFGKNNNKSIIKKQCGLVLKFYPEKQNYTININNPPYLPCETYRNWDIIRLENKGKFIIRTQINGKTYEIQFN